MNQLTKIENKSIGPAHLLELAITSGSNIETLEKMMDLSDRWEKKEAKKAFFFALAEFQSKCPTIIKRKQAHNYKYAPMADVVTQVKILLGECNLSYRFEQKTIDREIHIACIASHIDGHSERMSMSAPMDNTGSKNVVQAIGSTVSYLQRYTFLGSFGIPTADEDIDGRLPENIPLQAKQSSEQTKAEEITEKLKRRGVKTVAPEEIKSSEPNLMAKDKSALKSKITKCKSLDELREFHPACMDFVGTEWGKEISYAYSSKKLDFENG